MPYVFERVQELQEKEKVGTHQCVALIQHFTDAGPTSAWATGQALVGNRYIARGTAIATFVNGRYPNLPHRNHAAFFVAVEGNQIRIMDQWNDSRKPTISSRLISSKGKNRDGTFNDPSNNADAFSVIEPY